MSGINNCCLKEHRYLSGMCLFIGCDMKFRIFCIKCNSIESHNHNQINNNHIINFSDMIDTLKSNNLHIIFQWNKFLKSLAKYMLVNNN